MTVYLCALYCVACVCVSLPLHDACAKNGAFPHTGCGSLRVGLTGVVLTIVLYRMQHADTVEDALVLAIPLVLCIAVLFARVHRGDQIHGKVAR